MDTIRAKREWGRAECYMGERRGEGGGCIEVAYWAILEVPFYVGNGREVRASLVMEQRLDAARGETSARLLGTQGRTVMQGEKMTRHRLGYWQTDLSHHHHRQ